MSDSEPQLRMNVTVRGETARVILDAAASTHLPPATVAKSMLVSLASAADPESQRISDLLSRIPGAQERIERSREQAQRGETFPLREL